MERPCSCIRTQMSVVLKSMCKSNTITKQDNYKVYMERQRN